MSKFHDLDESNISYLDIVSENGREYQNIPLHLRTRELLIAAISSCGEALQYAEDHFTNDFEIVMLAVSQSGYSLQYASDNLKNNKEIVMKAVEEYGFPLEFASERCKSSKKCVEKALLANGMALQYASDEMKNNASMVTLAIRTDASCCKYVSQSLLNDPIFMYRVIEINPSCLEFASPFLRGDRDFVMSISGLSIDLSFLSDKLRSDREIVLSLVEMNPSNIQHSLLRDDLEILMMCVAKDGNLLQYAELMNESLVECALSTVPSAIVHVVDARIVLTMLRRFSCKSEWINPKLWDNRDFVVQCVDTIPCLNYTTFQNDREIVLKSISKFPATLQYTSRELQDDPDIVLVAVTQDYESIVFASKNCKSHLDICLAMVKNYKSKNSTPSPWKRVKNVFTLIPSEVKKNVEFINQVKSIDVQYLKLL